MNWSGFDPRVLEQLKLRQRLERIEEQMLDACCPFSSRYRELEQERAAVARRLRELSGVSPR